MVISNLQVEFEDRIITDRTAWEATGVSPFGQAPLLEVDGKPIAQTGAIARYCGKLSGHYPKVLKIPYPTFQPIVYRVVRKNSCMFELSRHLSAH